ncbi:MAG: methyltransferase domain-containing protein [Kiritimatiellae bacterium]|nr:methyltransferase domain-containing protein [Kiritimatiellia bacterium]
MADFHQDQNIMAGFPTASKPMHFFCRLGMESVAWSLRRLHCPVDSNALVLEVGAGGNPYARANVLLDSYEETRERHWVPLKVDRPFVLAFGESLPFKDRVFDFVIASHVLEHSPAPERFLAELQRVARAGYIEVPDAFLERVNPYRDHRAEITVRDGRLVIRKKPAWVVDAEVVELYEDRVKKPMTREWMPKRPFACHTRFYWRDRIEYVILNPATNSAWAPPSDGKPPAALSASFRTRIREALAGGLYSLFSQSARNRRINLLDLLLCPACTNPSLSKTEDLVRCPSCGADYPIRDGIWVMQNRKKCFDDSRS